MNKRITNKTNQNTEQMTIKKRIAISSGLTLTIASFASFFIIGFSFTALSLMILGLLSSTGLFLYHYISSGAYLPKQKEKTIRQKLIGLKFKLSDDYGPILEKAIDIEKKNSINEKLLSEVLGKFFQPTEVTYQRYFESGIAAIHSIQANLELIANKFTTLQQIQNIKNKEQIVDQIEISLKKIEELSDAFEGLIMSFEACEVSLDREEVFEQLQELANRTKKYMNI